MWKSNEWKNHRNLLSLKSGNVRVDEGDHDSDYKIVACKNNVNLISSHLRKAKRKSG